MDAAFGRIYNSWQHTGWPISALPADWLGTAVQEKNQVRFDCDRYYQIQLTECPRVPTLAEDRPVPQELADLLTSVWLPGLV